jgi:DNA replication protein DnaC
MEEIMNQILTTLKELKLHGMVECLETQDILKQDLSFEEKLEFLLHYESTLRKNKKIKRLFADSNLRQNTRLEDIQSDEKRGITRTQLLSLMRLDFINQKRNLIITGATGCGKTYLACAIGNKCCIEGYTVKFIKLPTFLEEIQLSHETGTFIKMLNKLISYDLLILDDFGLTNIEEKQLHDLFNIIDERYKIKSTIITSQLPTSSWHAYFKHPTMADAILDRLLSQTDKFELTGDSLRWDENKDKLVKNSKKLEEQKNDLK